MSDWAVPIVSGVIGSLIGGGIVAIIIYRLDVKSKFDSRLRGVESRLSFIEGKLSNFGQTPIAELTQKQAIQDRERISKPQHQ